MTAPVANPSRSLQLSRLRKKIRALNARMIEPGADVAVLRAGVAAHEAEIVALRREGIREAFGSEWAERYVHLWTDIRA